MLDNLARDGWSFTYSERTDNIAPSKPEGVTDEEVFRVRGLIRDQREAVVFELQAEALTEALFAEHGGYFGVMALGIDAYEDAYASRDIRGMQRAAAAFRNRRVA